MTDADRRSGEETTVTRRALIVTDVQNDFLPGGALAVEDSDRIIPVINRLLPRFRTIIATADWHPPNHCSFAENHPGRKPGDIVQVEGLEQILWPAHCVENTPGAQFSFDLEAERFDAVVRKGTDPRVDSYSAFFDNGRRNQTELDRLLKQRGVTDLFVCGLTTDYCVRFTALDALRLGYETWVVRDACQPVNLEPGDGHRALAEMADSGAHVLADDDIPSES